MSAFNDLNGVPTSANRYTLTEILRGQLGFNGFVVSDFNSIGELVAHGYAADRKEAGKKALLAGVDMDMVTESFRFDIPELVEAGVLPVGCGRRGCAPHLARQVLAGAVRSAVPLQRRERSRDHAHRRAPGSWPATPRAGHGAAEERRRHPAAEQNRSRRSPSSARWPRSPGDMLGSWSFTGSPRDVVSMLSGIQAAAGADVQSITPRAATLPAKQPADFPRPSEQLARWADVVIAVVGETAAMSGEAASRMELGLPAPQEDPCSRRCTPPASRWSWW